MKIYERDSKEFKELIKYFNLSQEDLDNIYSFIYFDDEIKIKEFFDYINISNILEGIKEVYSVVTTRKIKSDDIIVGDKYFSIQPLENWSPEMFTFEELEDIYEFIDNKVVS